MNKVLKIYKKRATVEGAGVKLFRIFGEKELPNFDPFLLLDHLGSSNPNDYMKGFPWHPHRGIQTVTYLLNGEIEHGDSLGSKGLIKSGDVQWMTAGSGVIHQEMPKKTSRPLDGFQLWINLTKEKKMRNPGYREILSSTIPRLNVEDFSIKVIAGSFRKLVGPVAHLGIQFYDIKLKSKKKIWIPIRKKHNSFAYLIKGSALVDEKVIKEGNCILFEDNERIGIDANTDLHFLFVSGKRINEPIAWGGPIVMNTEKELTQAFKEIEDGTFIKKK